MGSLEIQNTFREWSEGTESRTESDGGAAGYNLGLGWFRQVKVILTFRIIHVTTGCDRFCLSVMGRPITDNQCPRATVQGMIPFRPDVTPPAFSTGGIPFSHTLDRK